MQSERLHKTDLLLSALLCCLHYGTKLLNHGSIRHLRRAQQLLSDSQNRNVLGYQDTRGSVTVFAFALQKTSGNGTTGNSYYWEEHRTQNQDHWVSMFIQLPVIKSMCANQLPPVSLTVKINRTIPDCCSASQ